MNKVIVIGGFHHNTYGLIRSLGEAGIKSYVILEPCHPKMNWLFVSKYIIGNYILSEGENLVDYLLTTFSNEKSIASVSFQSNVARNAGDAFYIDEQMYRPAQDCNKCYGNGIEIQKVNKEENTFVFETITSFHSDNPDYSLGYHTFNMKNGLIVVDGHRYRFPRMVKFLGLLHKIRSLKK